MTICFIGNKYKYEIEAVVKLFIPLESFQFIFLDEGKTADDISGDLISIKRISNDGKKSLEVYVSINENNSHDIHTIQVDENSDDELLLCRMLFKCLSTLTGIIPPWGCLTGIRPVKKVNDLINKGFNKAEIFKILKEDYFVSDKKLELAYQTALTQSAYLEKLDRRSFSLYISIPFCPSRCSYCSFVSHSIENSSAVKLLPEYINKLCCEIEMTAEIAERIGLSLDTVYIGGGTPTSLSAENIDVLMQSVKKNIDISKIREYTIEAGRSDTITAQKLEVIRKNGATRISVNPQTMNDNVLRTVGRKHTAKDVEDSFKLARSLGFNNINMDIIAGLPTDTFEGFKYTLDTLCGFDPESITVHTLTVKRSSSLFNDRSTSFYNDIESMVAYGHEKLGNAGYIPYYLYRQKNTAENLENTGYAKKGFESLYNVYIMEEAQTILAVGAAGSTKLVNPDTNKIVRIFNYKFPYEYISGFDKMTDRKNKITEFYSDIIF